MTVIAIQCGWHKLTTALTAPSPPSKPLVCKANTSPRPSGLSPWQVPLTGVARKCHFCLRFAHYRASQEGFRSNDISCNVWHTLYLQWCICNGLLAIIYLRWQLEIIVALCCMSYHWKAYEALRITVKPVWKAHENGLRYRRIASKIFSMLKLLLQAIASNKGFSRSRHLQGERCKHWVR